MSFDLLICDCDGVLVDSEVLACRVDAEELLARGFTDYPLTEILRRFAGVSQTDMMKAIETESGRALGPGFADAVARRVHQALETELLPLPGVAEVLSALAIRKCVASSSAPKKLQLALGVTGLAPLFEPHIYSAVLVERGKPAPDLFLHAAREMALTPERCCVIEDSAAGVAAGVAAGMRVIGFTGGSHCLDGHADRLRSLGAHAIVERWEEIPALLMAL